jgi:hypothetical protein
MFARIVRPISGRPRNDVLGFLLSTFGLPFVSSGLANPTIAPQRLDPQGAIRTVTLPLLSFQTPLAPSSANASPDKTTEKSPAIPSFLNNFNVRLP